MKITKQRLKQIILEEVTNRLLAEKSTVLDPSEYGAVMEKPKGQLRIHIYKINKDNENDQIEVIGTITLSKLSTNEKPCIPKTFQVDSIAVKQGYKDRGIGLDLYRFAMAILRPEGYGITSDHKSGTKQKATDFWVRLGSDADKKTGLASKRKTAAGSDTFDYDGKRTPDDPDDDCETIVFDLNYATDHSFLMNSSEADLARSQLMKLMMNHINVKRAFENGDIKVAKLDNLNPNSAFARTTPNRGEQLEKYIIGEASEVFFDEYQKAK